ncbi:hypothetical protein O6H91_04G075300 [Diphasiastrum complanatum]|uniref:Uncharacterized protein n=1 Tax=Diphasiastrum complanatum TaxID=34168 RepID=A0ACC2DYD2_DIPCM|nr:hypothetical protein O6H91_04G075300 [Diphasiastrum complanatum]
MALKSVLLGSSNDPLRMSSVFSALLEVVLAFLFLLSVCISITASTIIRLFRLRPPCFCTKLYSGKESSNPPRKQENSERLLCNYHSNKLSLLQKLILNRGIAPVHSLCEDCMLLNCSSTETITAVNSNPNKCFSSDDSVHVNSCQICLFKKQRCCLPSACIEESVGEGRGEKGLQGEVGSDSGSSDCSTKDRSGRQLMTYVHSQCSCCKQLITEKVPRNEFVKEKFAKVFVEDFEEQFCEPSYNAVLPETVPVPFCVTEESEALGSGSFKNHPKEEDKYKETSRSRDDPMLDNNATLDDYQCIDKTGYDSEVQPQSYHLSEGEVMGGELLHYISEEDVEPEAIAEEDHTEVAALPLVDVEPQIDAQQDEVDVIKELKDALEAEREAYSAIYTELEEERNASAIAANETMAMISRLQEEKAAIQMEARQFKRMVEEKAVFDQEAIALLKEILCKREEEKFALENEVELYRSRLLDNRIGKWRRQRLKREEFEKHCDKEKLKLAEWNRKPVLLLEGRKDKEIVKESQELQVPFKDDRSSAGFDFDLTGTSSLIERGSKSKRLKDSKTWESTKEIGSQFKKRHDELLPSGSGKNLLVATESVGTKYRGGDSLLIRATQESKDEIVYSEVILQEASLALDNDICEQKLTVSPDIAHVAALSGEQSCAVDNDGRSKAAAAKVEHNVFDPWEPALSTEMQHLGQIAAGNWQNLCMDTTETLSRNSSIVNNVENGWKASTLEDDYTMRGTYSQKEGEEHPSNGRSIFHNEDEFQLEPCNSYTSELLDDSLSIQVDSMNMIGKSSEGSTEMMKCQQVVDVRATPLSFVRYEIDNELYELPSDLNFSEEFQKDFPESQLFERHNSDSAHNTTISSCKLSLALDDKQTSERESNDTKFFENSPPLLHYPKERYTFHDTPIKVSDQNPQSEVFQELENGWQYGTNRERGQDKSFLEQSDRLAGFDEQTSDDTLDLDSLGSADEYILGTSDYDLRTASMVRRDYQRMAVQEEVNQLTSRLQVLEDDRQSMKHIMESLRSENGETRLLHDVERQLQQLHGFEEKLDNLKMILEPGEPTVLSMVMLEQYLC